MNEIIEIKPNSYVLKGTNKEVSFLNPFRRRVGDYQCFEMDGKIGVSKNHSVVIIPALYDEIKCETESSKQDRNKEEIKYFEYRIDVSDEQKQTYYVYGRIYPNKSIYQDIEFYESKSSYRTNERFIELPQNSPNTDFLFIRPLFGPYYLYKDIEYGYGIFKYDEFGRIQFVHSDNFPNEYPWGDKFDSFGNYKWNDTGSYICLYRNKTLDNNGDIKTVRECNWFLYSPILQRGTFKVGYSTVMPIKSFFWIIKEENGSGLLDPYLKQIVPSSYSKIEIGNNDIDFVVASDNSNYYGVLKLKEVPNTPLRELEGDPQRNRTYFYRKFIFETYIPFKYNKIERTNDFLVLEDSNKLQCVYNIKENRRLTPFVFSNEWVLMPETIGEGLIGAYLKGHNSYKPDESPNLKYSFFDIASGEEKLRLSSKLWIKSGFKKGKAVVTSTDWEEYKIDKNGRRYNINTSPNLALFEREEDWNPYWDEYSEDETDNFYGLTDGMEGDLW